ncbi:MAG: hypothetical protein COA67_02140 [Lutibacter sp.]|nr:MAG: hypothetical protein COA67_02140 [Lutibacter sp.]
MSDKDYLKDISEIKEMMNKSSRFISLSGLSGILAGIYALVGAYLAKFILANYNYLSQRKNPMNIDETQFKLIVIAVVVAVLSIVTAFILTRKKAKQHGTSIWDSTTKRLLFNFLVPLFTGGIFSLILLNQGFYGFIAPATLIFYGLALFSASKYTFGNVKYLGIAEIILGLISMNYIGYGLYFWAIGFGVLHIIYGTLMYFKYDK